MHMPRAITRVVLALSLLVAGHAAASNDPVSVNPNTGANFNRYAYAANSPYTFVDPDGREVDYASGGKLTKTPPALISRMSQSETARGELRQIEDSKLNYIIAIDQNASNWYNSEDRIIEIRPDSAFTIDSSGAQQAPEVTAAHEISHAAQHDRVGDQAFSESLARPSGSQTSPEEVRATQIEQKVGQELRLPTREDYSDIRGQ